MKAAHAAGEVPKDRFNFSVSIDRIEGLPSHQDYPRLRVAAAKAETNKALDAVRLRELKHGESSQGAGPVAPKPLKFGLNLNRAQLVTATAVHDRKIVHLSLQGQVQAAFLPSWMERWDDLAVFDVDMSLFSRADGSHSVPLTLESPGTAGLEGPVRMHVTINSKPTGKAQRDLAALSTGAYTDPGRAPAAAYPAGVTDDTAVSHTSGHTPAGIAAGTADTPGGPAGTAADVAFGTTSTTPSADAPAPVGATSCASPTAAAEVGSTASGGSGLLEEADVAPELTSATPNIMPPGVRPPVVVWRETPDLPVTTIVEGEREGMESPPTTTAAGTAVPPPVQAVQGRGGAVQEVPLPTGAPVAEPARTLQTSSSTDARRGIRFAGREMPGERAAAAAAAAAVAGVAGTSTESATARSATPAVGSSVPVTAAAEPVAADFAEPTGTVREAGVTAASPGVSTTSALPAATTAPNMEQPAAVTSAAAAAAASPATELAPLPVVPTEAVPLELQQPILPAGNAAAATEVAEPLLIKEPVGATTVLPTTPLPASEPAPAAVSTVSAPAPATVPEVVAPAVREPIDVSPSPRQVQVPVAAAPAPETAFAPAPATAFVEPAIIATAAPVAAPVLPAVAAPVAAPAVVEPVLPTAGITPAVASPLAAPIMAPTHLMAPAPVMAGLPMYGVVPMAAMAAPLLAAPAAAPVVVQEEMVAAPPPPPPAPVQKPAVVVEKLVQPTPVPAVVETPVPPPPPSVVLPSAEVPVPIQEAEKELVVVAAAADGGVAVAAETATGDVVTAAAAGPGATVVAAASLSEDGSVEEAAVAAIADPDDGVSAVGAIPAGGLTAMGAVPVGSEYVAAPALPRPPAPTPAAMLDSAPAPVAPAPSPLPVSAPAAVPVVPPPAAVADPLPPRSTYLRQASPTSSTASVAGSEAPAVVAAVVPQPVVPVQPVRQAVPSAVPQQPVGGESLAQFSPLSAAAKGSGIFQIMGRGGAGGAGAAPGSTMTALNPAPVGAALPAAAAPVGHAAMHTIPAPTGIPSYRSGIVAGSVLPSPPSLRRPPTPSAPLSPAHRDRVVGAVAAHGEVAAAAAAAAERPRPQSPLLSNLPSIGRSASRSRPASPLVTPLTSMPSTGHTSASAVLQQPGQILSGGGSSGVHGVQRPESPLLANMPSITRTRSRPPSPSPLSASSYAVPAQTGITSSSLAPSGGSAPAHSASGGAYVHHTTVAVPAGASPELIAQLAAQQVQASLPAGMTAVPLPSQASGAATAPQVLPSLARVSGTKRPRVVTPEPTAAGVMVQEEPMPLHQGVAKMTIPAPPEVPTGPAPPAQYDAVTAVRESLHPPPEPPKNPRREAAALAAAAATAGGLASAAAEQGVPATAAALTELPGPNNTISSGVAVVEVPNPALAAVPATREVVTPAPLEAYPPTPQFPPLPTPAQAVPVIGEAVTVVEQPVVQPAPVVAVAPLAPVFAPLPAPQEAVPVIGEAITVVETPVVETVVAAPPAPRFPALLPPEMTAPVIGEAVPVVQQPVQEVTTRTLPVPRFPPLPPPEEAVPVIGQAVPLPKAVPVEEAPRQLPVPLFPPLPAPEETVPVVGEAKPPVPKAVLAEAPPPVPKGPRFPVLPAPEEALPVIGEARPRAVKAAPVVEAPAPKAPLFPKLPPPEATVSVIAGPPPPPPVVVYTPPPPEPMPLPLHEGLMTLPVPSPPEYPTAAPPAPKYDVHSDIARKQPLYASEPEYEEYGSVTPSSSSMTRSAADVAGPGSASGAAGAVAANPHLEAFGPLHEGLEVLPVPAPPEYETAPSPRPRFNVYDHSLQGQEANHAAPGAVREAVALSAATAGAEAAATAQAEHRPATAAVLTEIPSAGGSYSRASGVAVTDAPAPAPAASPRRAPAPVRTQPPRTTPPASPRASPRTSAPVVPQPRSTPPASPRRLAPVQVQQVAPVSPRAAPAASPRAVLPSPRAVPVSPRVAPAASPRAAVPSSPRGVPSTTPVPLSPGAQQAAANWGREGPLHDGLVTLPIPSPAEYETGVAPSPRKNVIEEIRGNNPLAEAPGYDADGLPVIQRPAAAARGKAPASHPATGAAVADMPASGSSTSGPLPAPIPEGMSPSQYLASQGPLHEGTRILPVPTPPEYETAPSPRPRFNVYDHSLQGQEAYHAAPGALQKEAGAELPAGEGLTIAEAPAGTSPRRLTPTPAPVRTQQRSTTPPASPRRAATPVSPRAGPAASPRAVSPSPRAAVPVSPRAVSPSPTRAAVPSSPRGAGVTPVPLSPGAQQAADAYDKQGPLHDGLIVLPIPSPAEYETGVAPSPRKNVIEEIRGNNPLAEAPGYDADGLPVIQRPAAAARGLHPASHTAAAVAEVPGGTGAAVAGVPGGSSTSGPLPAPIPEGMSPSQYLASQGPLHEGTRILPVPTPPEYETAPSPRPRFNVYDHSLQGQEAYHAAPGALQKEAVATAAATAGAAAAATAQAEHRPATAAARTEIPAPDGSTAEGVAVVEAPAPSPTSTPPRQGLSQLRPLNSHPLTLNTPESPLTSPRVTAPSSPAMSSMTRSPAVPASPTAAAASDRQGPLHDGLRILPVPSPPEYETGVAPSPRKNVIEEIRGNNPLAEAPGYSEGQAVVPPSITAMTRPPVPPSGSALVKAPGAVGAAVTGVPAETTSTQYMAEFGPLHEGARVLPIPTPPEYETAPSPRPRFNVYDHSLQGQEAYHAAPGALQKEAGAEFPAAGGYTAAEETAGAGAIAPPSPRRVTQVPSSPRRAAASPVPPAPLSVAPAPAGASDNQGPLHDGLAILPVPSPPEYETSVAPSPRKNVIEEIRGNNPLAEAPGYSEGQTVVQPTIAALTRPPVPLGGTAMVEAPGAVGAAVREVPAGTTSTQYMAEFGPLHEGARVLPIPTPPEYETGPSPRPRFNVYDHSLQGQEAYHAAPGAVRGTGASSPALRASSTLDEERLLTPPPSPDANGYPLTSRTAPGGVSRTVGGPIDPTQAAAAAVAQAVEEDMESARVPATEGTAQYIATVGPRPGHLPGVDVEVHPAAPEERPLVEESGVRITVPGRGAPGGPVGAVRPAAYTSPAPADSYQSPAVLIPVSQPGVATQSATAPAPGRPPLHVASDQSMGTGNFSSEDDDGHVVEEETAILLGGSSPHAEHLARDYHRSELHDTRGLSLNNPSSSNNNDIFPAEAAPGVPLEGDSSSGSYRDVDAPPQQQSSRSDPKGVDAAAGETSSSSSSTHEDTSAVASYGLGGALASAAAAAASAPANAVRSALRVAQGYFTGGGSKSRDGANDDGEQEVSAQGQSQSQQQQQQPPPSPRPSNVGDVKAAARAAEATMSGRSSYADLSELAGLRSGTVTPTHSRSPRGSELGAGGTGHREGAPPTVVVTGGQNIVVAGGPGILAPGGPAMAAGAGPGVITEGLEASAGMRPDVIAGYGPDAPRGIASQDAGAFQAPGLDTPLNVRVMTGPAVTMDSNSPELQSILSGQGVMSSAMAVPQQLGLAPGGTGTTPALSLAPTGSSTVQDRDPAVPQVPVQVVRGELSPEDALQVAKHVVDASDAAIHTADKVAAMTANDDSSIGTAPSTTNVDPSLSLQPWTLDQSAPVSATPAAVSPREQGAMMGSAPQQGQVLRVVPADQGFDQRQAGFDQQQPGFDQEPLSPGEQDLQYRKQQQYEQYMQGSQAVPSELELPVEGGMHLTPPATPEMQAPPAAAARSPPTIARPRQLQYPAPVSPTANDVEERDARRRALLRGPSLERSPYSPSGAPAQQQEAPASGPFTEESQQVTPQATVSRGAGPVLPPPEGRALAAPRPSLMTRAARGSTSALGFMVAMPMMLASEIMHAIGATGHATGNFLWRIFCSILWITTFTAALTRIGLSALASTLLALVSGFFQAIWALLKGSWNLAVATTRGTLYAASATASTATHVAGATAGAAATVAVGTARGTLNAATTTAQVAGSAVGATANAVGTVTHAVTDTAVQATSAVVGTTVGATTTAARGTWHLADAATHATWGVVDGAVRGSARLMGSILMKMAEGLHYVGASPRASPRAGAASKAVKPEQQEQEQEPVNKASGSGVIPEEEGQRAVERGRMLVDVPPGVPQAEQQHYSGQQQQQQQQYVPVQVATQPQYAPVQFVPQPQPQYERAQVVVLDQAPAAPQQQYDTGCKSEVVVYPQEQVTLAPQQVTLPPQYEASVNKGMPAGQTFYAGNPAYSAQQQYAAGPTAGAEQYQPQYE